MRGVLALEWTEGKTERRSPKTVKACRRSRQTRGVWHASCWRKTLRLNRLLRPAGRAIMRAAARGKGAALEKRQDPRGALPFFSPAASPKRRAKTFDYDALIFLFAAQPIKVFRRGLFSKRPERSRLSFSPKPFFKKAGGYSASRPQHFLYFLPLPQGQGSFRPTFLTVRGRFSSVPSLSPRLS